ncbi:hypothetical protein LCGC14_1647380 [marine sediment metagenome]|uniref:Uncharacterized protein n=1 Tax=marine sediment metagenome TaxID=412755 RepID=A0A0F9HYK9_9ZZZZ
MNKTRHGAFIKYVYVTVLKRGYTIDSVSTTNHNEYLITLYPPRDMVMIYGYLFKSFHLRAGEVEKL